MSARCKSPGLRFLVVATVAGKVVAAEVVAAEVEDDYAWARSCGSWSSSTAICCWFIMNPILFNW